MLDEEHLQEAFKNTINGSKSSIDLFAHLIEKSGCFRQGLAKDERQENYNRGFGDFGLYLRSLFMLYAPDTYIEILKRGVAENDTRTN
jgi:hypothetical protein